MAAAVVLALGGIAAALRDPIYLLIDAALIVLVFVIYFIGALWFANHHPGVALLEGAELIQWRQMDIAENTSKPIENIPVPPKPQIGIEKL